MRNTHPAIQRFLIRYEISESLLALLRDSFPGIDFIVGSENLFPQQIAVADALLAWRLTTEELRLARNLRWVQWIGAGVDDAPLQELAGRSIVLTNNRGVHANNVAEHVIAMMLALARNFPLLVRAQHERAWRDAEGRSDVRELAGSRMLVVGAGNIGFALASKATCLGIEVDLLGRRQRVSEGRRLPVKQSTELDRLLPTADHVAICLPLTPDTFQLFDRPRIESMKKGAFLYNIGRGPIVDTTALTNLLESGHLGGAGLDVVDPEPLPPEHRLWAIPNVLITAHTAGATPNYWARAFEILVENIGRFNSGQPLRNQVDLAVGY
jgi:phosphoglycerate dehydrogenase-like enzyme